MQIVRKNKKAQFAGFKWLLSIIIGAIILFLALYFTGVITGTTGKQVTLTVSQQISILLDPFSFSGVAEASAEEMSMPLLVLMNLSCDSTSIIDSERIDVSVKKTAKSKPTPIEEYVIYNKYIFTNSSIESKSFYVFAKPIFLPFHIANSVYILDRNYCFRNAPTEIKDEIQALNITLFSIENCTENSAKVCFNQPLPGCDVTVFPEYSARGYEESSYDTGYITRKGENLYYVTRAMMYAAIFSDSKIYKCNLKRLERKISSLVSIYNSKALALQARGCNLGNAINELKNLNSSASLLQNANSLELLSLFATSKDLARANEGLDCKIF